MKGYYTDNGYMRLSVQENSPVDCFIAGYINGGYRLFADETDYREYLEDEGRSLRDQMQRPRL